MNKKVKIEKNNTNEEIKRWRKKKCIAKEQ